MRYFALIAIIMVLVLSTGCEPQPTAPAVVQTIAVATQQPAVVSTTQAGNGYPAPESTAQAGNGYPAPTTPNGYPAPATATEVTAFDAYQVALPYAQKWNSKAVLYLIPATYQQQISFGQSAEANGWFFMFKTPDSPLEYYIDVINGKYEGGKEAQQIYAGKTPPPYEFQPLPDLSKMINSDKFTELYMKNGGSTYLASNPTAVFNSQLAFSVGDTYPIWRMYDATKIKDNTVLFAVNALTGDIVEPK